MLKTVRTKEAYSNAAEGLFEFKGKQKKNTDSI